ncbi:MAG: hypothetical protein ACRDGT_06710 [Candidatus Limnocylindria bacterium]
MSPVEATVELEGDAGVASPIFVHISRFPATFLVRFDGPIDRATFQLQVVPFDSCGYGLPSIDQESRWVSDREAQITIRPPFPLSNYAVAFGGGRDPQGREVQEPQFQFMPESQPRMGRVGQFAMPSGPTAWTGEVSAYTPRSISPDGRYALLTREIYANVDGHTWFRIPYVLDISTGALTVFPRGEVREIRWELDRQAIWINGTTYLDLGLPGTLVDRIDRLPATAHQIAAAQVSPDRRWLAAILGSNDPMQLESQAELVLVDLATGATTSRRGQLRAIRSPGGGWPDALSWAPDSRSVLVTSYLSFADQGDGFGFLAEYYVAAVPDLTLTRVAGIGDLQGRGPAQWAPAGQHIAIPGIGIVGADGAFVFREPKYWPTRIWSANGRFTLVAKGDAYRYEVLDLTSGSGSPVGLAIDPGRPIYILGISDEGTQLYVGDPYGR